ncbi:tetratricopeptide repeat protein [bacterium]|nr:tetratricopeptide repeat protein [bacterium]
MIGKYRRSIVGLCVLAVLAVGAATSRAVVEKHAKEQAREPKVTKQEADILSQVVQLSEEKIKQALALLRSNVKTGSSSALDFSLGNIYFQLEQYTQAEIAYRKALSKMPSFDRARANLARLLLQQEKTEAALKELQCILITGVPKPAVLTLTGYTYLLREQPIPAESAYRQALLLRPDDSNAYLGLAKALLLQERFKEASKILEDVLQKHPQRGELWSLLANARLGVDDPKAAIVALEAARRLGVGMPEALATLGDLYLNQGQYQEAVRAYQQAFAGAKPSLGRLFRAIEGFLLAHEPESAASLLKQARALRKQSRLSESERSRLLWLEARAVQQSGNSKQALHLYRSLLEKDPLHGQAIIALGELYQTAGEKEKAVMAFARAARISRFRAEALTKQAQVEVELGNYTRAIELLTLAQSLQPRENVARYLKQLRNLER